MDSFCFLRLDVGVMVNIEAFADIVLEQVVRFITRGAEHLTRQ